MYEYKGRVVRVIDSKSLLIHVDLGFKIYANIWCNIDDFGLGNDIIPILEELILGKVVYFTSHKEKNINYDVYLVDIAFDHERELFLLSVELKKYVVHHPV